MKKCYSIVLLILLVLFVSCQKEEVCNDILTLEITVAVENDWRISELLTDEYINDLEKTFDINLEFTEENNIEDLKENADINFSDALITDYNIWLVPLSDGNFLQQIKDVQMSESQFGKNGGRQFGYVLSGKKQDPVEPVLVVNVDMMKTLGFENEEFTHERFLEILEKLKDIVSVPLGVYGSPTDPGFGALLGLFGLTVTGGHEFYIDGKALHFDKIEDDAQQYLKYVNQLYKAGLIPSDCLSLSEYSCRIMFANKRCAMTMASSLDNAKDLVEYAYAKGVEAAIVKLPVPEGLLERNVFNRTIGVISKNNLHAELLTQIFAKIKSDIQEINSTEEADDIQYYSLFVGQSPLCEQDLLEENFQDFHRFYEKHIMDDEIIRPYFCQMMVGNIALEMFSDMKTEWMNSYDINVETFENNLSGRGLLQIFYAWVDKIGISK